MSNGYRDILKDLVPLKVELLIKFVCRRIVKTTFEGVETK